jgi:hypothetical protein
MQVLKKIKQILSDQKLDLADKLIEIERLLPKTEPIEVTEVFDGKCSVKREGNSIIFDGSYGQEYTDNPRLKNPDDLYYTGCGCTWDTDLDGIRFWKRYNPIITRDGRFNHLSYGDIINEKARIKKIVQECLNELT